MSGDHDPIDRYFDSIKELEKYRKGFKQNDSEWRANLLVEYLNSDFDPEKLTQALLIAWASNTSPPTWLVHELLPILNKVRHTAPGPGQHTHVSRAERFHVDIHRGWAVWRLLRSGVRKLEVYQAAADELDGTEYEGTDETMKKAWQRVKGYFPPIG